MKSKPNPTATQRRPQEAPEAAPDKDPELQGEGNYSAARRYRRSAQAFVKDAKVGPAAAAAAPEDDARRREMQAAERAGRSHARK